MFEQASRLKLRFDTPVGSVSTEDLWDLPLLRGKANLDDLAKSLNKLVKESGEESFVVKKSNKNETLELMFEIVKHVISVKLQEKEAAKIKEEAKEKKSLIMSILADKENEELKGKSIDELRALMESL